MQASDDRAAVAAVVTALYRTLLLREPDRPGLDAYVDAVLAGGLSYETVIARLLGSAEFARQTTAFLHRYRAGAALPFTNDVSQNGEVFALLKLMIDTAARHRIVVDVGARGRERSNSYDLLRHFRWRGLLIEANPRLIPMIQEEFAGLDQEILNVAVSDHAGSAAFWFGVNDDVSSLSRGLAENWGPVAGSTVVRVERLADILHSRDIPPDFELLSVDAEGEDIRIVNDLLDTSAYRPRWIILEVPPTPPAASLADLPFCQVARDAYALMQRVGPNLILRARV